MVRWAATGAWYQKMEDGLSQINAKQVEIAILGTL
jgi:hypothetical protein